MKEDKIFWISMVSAFIEAWRFGWMQQPKAILILI
jgi:hypothetical protein